jgi:hypothetical protein
MFWSAEGCLEKIVLQQAGAYANEFGERENWLK